MGRFILKVIRWCENRRFPCAALKNYESSPLLPTHYSLTPNLPYNVCMSQLNTKQNAQSKTQEPTKTPEPSPSSESPERPRPLLFYLLGAIVLLGLVSIPWQMKNWEKARQLQAETAAQEARLREVRESQASVTSAEKSLSNASPTDWNARWEAARALLSRGNSSGAGKLLMETETAVLADPALTKDANIAANLAGLFQDAGWVDRALPNAQRALELSPNSVENLLRLALIEAQSAWQDDCRKHIAEAQKLAPDAAEPHLALALMNDQVGALKPAEQELMAADKIRPNNPQITLLLFQNRMSQKRYDDALATIEKAVQSSPTDTGFLAARAQALAERATSRPGAPDQAELKTALDAIRRYQQLSPEDPATPAYMAGKVLRAIGDEEGALREWEVAYKAQPSMPGLGNNLGRLLVRRGDKKRGSELIARDETARADSTEYNRLLTTAGMNRKDAEKQRALARWCQSHGRLSRAILAWEQILAVQPNDVEAKREREICLTKRSE